MPIKSLTAVILFLFLAPQVWAQQQQTVYLLWQSGKNKSGTISATNGQIHKLEIIRGKGKVKKGSFSFAGEGEAGLAITVTNVRTAPGPFPTLISVATTQQPFSFLLRDATKEYPIYIPVYGVAVCPEEKGITYAALAGRMEAKGLQNKLQRIQSEAEASFDAVAKTTRDQKVPTWLGISRDMRIFQVSEAIGNKGQEVNTITPLNANNGVPHPSDNNRPLVYSYQFGRGQGVEQQVARRLEEGILPILHTTLLDDDIRYQTTQFVALEKEPLAEGNIRGTHYLVADKNSGGHMFTPEQEAQLSAVLQGRPADASETVLYVRTLMINTGRAPQYAWARIARPGRGWWDKVAYAYDAERGFSSFSDAVFCISKLNGKPLPNEEMAVLLQPGDTAVLEFFLPHAPLTEARASALAQQSFDDQYTHCTTFWKKKLEGAARIRLPERRIEEMLQAGLLHLDLVTYGLEPDSTVAPCIGVYSPIGTESSPIIQLYNSMGWHDLARRSLQYFLDKQHADGLIQNFGGYMVETGAALWSLGEYLRYTKDVDWLKRMKPKIINSCNYLLNWRNNNKKDSLKGKGYGMISGKVADPEDHFHQFMLNGYAYLGISRMAEALLAVDAAEAARLQREAAAWKEDIRHSFFQSMAHSPVVPLSDGTWLPTVPPWTEALSARALYTTAEAFFSHATFTVSDALLGPLYLVFTEVLAPEEEAAQMMLQYHRELFYQNNAAFSQPYYSRHNWLQLKLGATKAFLKTYYTTVSALADRETYSFWEHLYQVSPHKTHEEAWFLMETRWMLYLEEGNTLRLFGGIPRRWMKEGAVIELDKVASYFGPLRVHARSHVEQGYIEAEVECTTESKPATVMFRLPHPDGKKAVRITGGTYDAEKEVLVIKNFTGKASVRLQF